MNLQKIFKTALDVALLKPAAIKKVAADKGMTKPAFIVIAVASIAYALGFMIFPVTFAGLVIYRPGIEDVVLTAILHFGVMIAGLYILGYLGEQFFKSKVKMDAFVRVMGFASIVGVLALAPKLAVIGGIWQLVIFWKLMKEEGKLDTGAVIALLVLGVIVAAILASVASPYSYW